MNSPLDRGTFFDRKGTASFSLRNGTWLELVRLISDGSIGSSLNSVRPTHIALIRGATIVIPFGLVWSSGVRAYKKGLRLLTGVE